MFVRVKDKNNGKKSIQIVEAHRSADKVSQHIVRHVGQAFSDREIEELKRLAESIIIEMKNNRQHYGTKKYLQIIGGEATVNEAKIAEDSRWDGIQRKIYQVFGLKRSEVPSKI